YGFDIQDFQERIYLLYIFQVAFSSDEKRVQTFLQLRNWPESTGAYQSIHDIDWQAFQLEYRDHIDLAKLFQLVRGFGAIVGGIANYKFMNHLGETAINGYRMRLIESKVIVMSCNNVRLTSCWPLPREQRLPNLFLVGSKFYLLQFQNNVAY